jgi:hypothetical protein
MNPQVVALCAALAVPESVIAQRQDVPLGTDWQFHRGNLPTDGAVAWDSVAVPHTWNAKDAQDGLAAEPEFPDGYYRGPAGTSADSRSRLA